MASNSKEVAIDFPPFFQLFTDNTIHRFGERQFQPPSDDPTAAVRSKDIIINSDTNLSVRIFLPHNQSPPQKLPLVVYVHGGAFCVGSASSPIFHNFIATLTEKSNTIAVSIDYRLAPESPLPIAYEDSWAAFEWITAHSNGKGPDPWLNQYVDFRQVFLGGESAGANIANDVALRAGVSKFPGVEIEGMFLMHPWFGGKEVDKLYKVLYPTSSARDDDPRLYPAVDERIGKMAGRKVMFFVAEKDFLTVRAKAYYEGLKQSKWPGKTEIFETEDEGHCFYLFNLNSEKAAAVIDRLVAFLKNV